MRFNVGFVLLYVMPYVAVVASLWAYPDDLGFTTSQGEEVFDAFVRAAITYAVTVFFGIVWILKAKRSKAIPEDV